MKKIFIFAMMLVANATAFAQDEVETTISADVVSQYIWRGQDLGGASLQPTLGVSYKGLSLTGWGSIGLTDPTDTREFDLTLGYTIGGLSIAVTDYWFDQDGADPEGRYFKYDAHGTNHVFEGVVGYDFGFASLLWSTYFAGNDYKAEDGKRAYSSYVEATVPFKLANVDWTATVGAVPFASDAYNDGTSKFAVSNVSLKATKSIKITESFSVPVFAQVAANPCTQHAYLVFGLTLQP